MRAGIDAIRQLPTGRPDEFSGTDAEVVIRQFGQEPDKARSVKQHLRSDGRVIRSEMETELTHLQYRTGEVILPGDVVEYFGDPGQVEYVVNGPTGNSEMDWNFRTNGTGVMVIEPKHFGRVYLTHSENDEHLVFISRAPGREA